MHPTFMSNRVFPAAKIHAGSWLLIGLGGFLFGAIIGAVFACLFSKELIVSPRGAFLGGISGVIFAIQGKSCRRGKDRRCETGTSMFGGTSSIDPDAADLPLAPWIAMTIREGIVSAASSSILATFGIIAIGLLNAGLLGILALFRGGLAEAASASGSVMRFCGMFLAYYILAVAFALLLTAIVIQALKRAIHAMRRLRRSATAP